MNPRDFLLLFCVAAAFRRASRSLSPCSPGRREMLLRRGPWGPCASVHFVAQVVPTRPTRSLQYAPVLPRSGRLSGDLSFRFRCHTLPSSWGLQEYDGKNNIHPVRPRVYKESI